jgi:sec-independent protein translocase protein TatA
MRIFGLGPWELALILGIILLLFGPKRLPQLGKSLGKTMRSIREGVEGKFDEEEEAEEGAAKPKAKSAKSESAEEGTEDED